MAIYLNTNNPQALLTDFSAKCKNKTIRTWEVNGNPALIHTGSDIGDRGFFVPRYEATRLCLFFSFFNKTGNRREAYGVLHGRLIEMFASHCYGGFSSGVFTPSPHGSDEAI